MLYLSQPTAEEAGNKVQLPDWKVMKDYAGCQCLVLVGVEGSQIQKSLGE